MEGENASPLIGAWYLATIGGAPAYILHASGYLEVGGDMTFSQWLELNGARVGTSGKVRDDGGGVFAFADPTDRQSPDGRIATLSSDGSVLVFPNMLFLGQATWAPA